MPASVSRKFSVAGLALLFICGTSAQVILSPSAAASNHSPTQAVGSAAKPAPEQPQSTRMLEEKSEQIRNACINGRRRICGRVVQIVPEGLVVESGYTNLLRPELGHSWLAPRTVVATRPSNLVEENAPNSLCVGLVFVTDIPKKPSVSLYDFVVLPAYPAGELVYTPVPTVKKTIRRFSVGLLTAIKLNFASTGK